MKKFLLGKSYWEDTYPKQISSGLWAFVDVAQKSLDQRVRKFQYRSLYAGRNNFFDDELGVDFYRINEGDKKSNNQNEVIPETNNGLLFINNETEWYKVQMERYDSLKLLDLAGRQYLSRNYENDSLKKIPSLGIDRNRNNDPFEDFLRKLLIGESLYRVMLRIWDVYEYLKNVSRQNEDYVFWSAVLGGGGSGFLLLMLVLYLMRIKNQMNNFYEILFNFKVIFFLIFRLKV